MKVKWGVEEEGVIFLVISSSAKEDAFETVFEILNFLPVKYIYGNKNTLFVISYILGSSGLTPDSGKVST